MREVMRLCNVTHEFVGIPRRTGDNANKWVISAY